MVVAANWSAGARPGHLRKYTQPQLKRLSPEGLIQVEAERSVLGLIP